MFIPTREKFFILSVSYVHTNCLPYEFTYLRRQTGDLPLAH